jgi:putative membrane protein
MKRFLIAVAAVTATMCAVAPGADAQQLERGVRNMSAESFAQNLGSGNQFEIQSSMIALQKSNNEAVKQFAHKMVEDHQAADQKLKDTLKAANLPVPSVVVDVTHMQKLDNLKVADIDFDRHYIQAQREAHRDTVKLLENYIQRGDNAQLKQFATNLLPTIKHHLEMADTLRPRESARR